MGGQRGGQTEGHRQGAVDHSFECIHTPTYHTHTHIYNMQMCTCKNTRAKARTHQGLLLVNLLLPVPIQQELHLHQPLRQPLHHRAVFRATAMPGAVRCGVVLGVCVWGGGVCVRPRRLIALLLLLVFFLFFVTPRTPARSYLSKPDWERPEPWGLVAVTLLPSFLPGSEKNVERPLLPADRPAGREEPPLVGSPEAPPEEDDSFLPSSPNRKLGRRCMVAPPAPVPAFVPASLPLDVCRRPDTMEGAPPPLWEPTDPTEEAERAELPSSSLFPLLLRPRLSPSI
jgi:hypothetical protein